MLAFVAEYLVKTGKISAQNCPVIKGNSKQYLLRTEPIHRGPQEIYGQARNRERVMGAYLISGLKYKDAQENIGSSKNSASIPPPSTSRR